MTGRQLSVSRFERKLRAITGVAGSNLLPGIEDLEGLITLEADRPEWALAGGERLAGAAFTQASVALQFAYVALINRRDSGVLLVVEHVRALGSGSSVLKLLGPAVVGEAVPFLPGEVASSFTTFVRDSRLFDEVVTGGIVNGSNVAALTAVATVANFTFGAQYDFPIILAPDTGLAVEGAAVATTAGMETAWREVPLEASTLG